MRKFSRAKFLLVLLAIAALATTLTYAARADQDDEVVLKARLTGFQEVPPKLTTATGTFTAKLIGNPPTSIQYTETWTGLTGITTPATSGPLFSHIHFGQRGVSAGIVVWLCGKIAATPPLNDPDNDLPPCPAGVTGTVSGTIDPADVIPTAAPDQGVNPGDFAGLLRIIRSGNAYVNIHTDRFPGGEIRGQIRVSEDEDDDH